MHSWFDRLPQADLELGDLGLGLFQGAAGLVHVELAGGAASESGFGDRQRLSLQLHVGLGVRDPAFECPHLHVVRGHVAQQGDQDVVVVRHRGVEVGRVRFDRPAEPAPEIEFPVEIEAEVPLAVKRLRDACPLAVSGSPHFGCSCRSIVCVCGKSCPVVMANWARASSTRKPASRSVRFWW